MDVVDSLNHEESNYEEELSSRLLQRPRASDCRCSSLTSHSNSLRAEDKAEDKALQNNEQTKQQGGEQPTTREKYEKHARKLSIIKHVSLFLVIVSIIIAIVFYIRKLKMDASSDEIDNRLDSKRDNALDFDADEIAAVTEQTNARSIEALPLSELNSALIQSETYRDPHNQQLDKSVDNKPVSDFNMPKFEIGGGVLSRTKTANDIEQAQPRFRSFVGFDRSQRGTEANLSEETLDDNNLGMFGRGQGKKLQKMKPRLTLAMRTQMTKSELDAIVNQTADQNASMSQAKQVLEGIKELKEKSKKDSKKKSKSKK